ncbi:unnamed protein product [Diatraea saccharalis]|uniref:Uncharacterized protein n=1 Tax=Diatraea saccharalis TaxID=40085 RepID=A0A9N9RE14_9NEOP|nr:unnamed protein product [Diatraea saccharalis]
MAEETTKDDNQPSASKKENQRTSIQDLFNDRRKYEERRDDQMSNSETYTSGSYSTRSRIGLVDARPEVPKQPIAKREAKTLERKKRGRKPGRVNKRRKSPTRRQVLRRSSRRKARIERDLSVSTIFSRLSSQSECNTLGCKFCGHRCCRKR